MVAAVTSVLNHIITWVTSGLLAQKEDAQHLIEQTYSLCFVPALINCAKISGNALSGKCISQLMNVLSELVLSSSKFLLQFVEADGLIIIDSLDCGVFDLSATNRIVAEEDAGLLKDWAKYSVEALISGLQISSQLARHSEQYFRSLLQVFTAKKLAMILQSSNAVIRAKACNLLGNMCRHSDRFYSTLSANVRVDRSNVNLIGLLCACCGDTDANTRKFASFAGEWCFLCVPASDSPHSSPILQLGMRPSIPMHCIPR